MQNRRVFRAYCLLLVFLVVLFLGLSLAKAWAIPEPGGVEPPEASQGWRLVLHWPEGGQGEYWLGAELPSAAENLPAWQLEEPYVPLRLLAEACGASLGWFEYYNGNIHTGAAVWLWRDKGVVWLPGCGRAFLLNPDEAPQAEELFARPLLLADTLCLPVQLLDTLGLTYQVEAGQVEIWLPEGSEDEINYESDNAVNNAINYEEMENKLTQAWQEVQPQLAEYWANQLGSQLLGAAETSFDPAQAGRTQNIFLAVQALHGWQAAPGEDFSFNEAVGPRTPERGFQVATIFENGQAVQGYGGGICQVSTTLYMALRQTELEILERHPHSLPVTYAPAGADATVAWEALDLRWRNNLAESVYLLCQIQGGRLRIEVWQGRAPQELPDIFKLP